jgi:hypothetical protein
VPLGVPVDQGYEIGGEATVNASCSSFALRWLHARAKDGEATQIVMNSTERRRSSATSPGYEKMQVATFGPVAAHFGRRFTRNGRFLLGPISAFPEDAPCSREPATACLSPTAFGDDPPLAWAMGPA